MSRREVMYNNSVVSYTALSDFMRCPKYFEYIFVLKKERTLNRPMTRGLDLHVKAQSLCKTQDPEEVKRIMRGYTEKEIDLAMRYAEYYIDKHIPTMTGSNGKQQEGIEFYDKVKLDRGLYFEYHADNVHFCKDGTLRIMDLKTGMIVPSKEQLFDDVQLLLYTWAVTENLRLSGMVVPPRVQMGWWLWNYGYNLFVDYEFPADIKDRIIRVAQQVKDARKNKEFPRTGHKFCPGCPMFATCNPIDIAESYKKTKELAEFWKEKAEAKRVELLNKMETIGTDTLEDSNENVMYYMKSKNFTSVDIDDLIAKTEGDINVLKQFLKPTKTALKEAGIEGIAETPQRTQVELHFKNIL